MKYSILFLCSLILIPCFAGESNMVQVQGAIQSWDETNIKISSGNGGILIPRSSLKDGSELKEGKVIKVMIPSSLIKLSNKK